MKRELNVIISSKAINAQAAGAVGVLIYNNDIGLLTPAANDANLTIPVVGLAKDDGIAVLDLVNKSEQLKVETPAEHHSFSVPTGGMHPTCTRYCSLSTKLFSNRIHKFF